MSCTGAFICFARSGENQTLGAKGVIGVSHTHGILPIDCIKGDTGCCLGVKLIFCHGTDIF